MPEAFQDERVLMTFVLGLFILASTIFGVVMILRPLKDISKALRDLVMVMQGDRAAERRGISHEIGSAISHVRSEFHHMLGADQIGPRRADDARWPQGHMPAQRSPHTGPKVPFDDQQHSASDGTEADDDIHLDDLLLGKHQLIMHVGSLGQPGDFLPLRIPGLPDGFDPTLLDEAEAITLWHFLSALVPGGRRLWEPHDSFSRWSWYQVLRSWMIEKYDFALCQSIEVQFPGLLDEPRYQEWKQLPR